MKDRFCISVAILSTLLWAGAGRGQEPLASNRTWTTVRQGETSTVVAAFERYAPEEHKVYFARPNGSKFRLHEMFLGIEDRNFLHAHHGVPLPVQPPDMPAEIQKSADPVPPGLSDAAAKKWVLAIEGNAAAQNSLGVMYQNGKDAPLDDATAMQWYLKAAEQGNADAQYNLGLLYQDGRSVKENDVEAARWYRKAAEQGSAAAQYNLGWMCQNGRGVPANDAEAIGWYRKAAEQGNADAQCNLGVLIESGRGGPPDHVAAMKFYRQAAEQGLAVAQNNLGVLYKTGKGGIQDDTEAIKWLRKSAQQGYAIAQTNLALMTPAKATEEQP